MALVIKADDIDDYFTCINYNPSYRLAAIIISNTNFTVRIKWYHLKIFKECLFLCSCRYTVDCLAASTAMKQTPMFSLLSVAFSYNKSHLCSWHILNTEMSVTMVSVEILRPLEKKKQKKHRATYQTGHPLPWRRGRVRPRWGCSWQQTAWRNKLRWGRRGAKHWCLSGNCNPSEGEGCNGLENKIDR